MSDSGAYSVRVVRPGADRGEPGLATLARDELADEALTDEALTMGAGFALPAGFRGRSSGPPVTDGAGTEVRMVWLVGPAFDCGSSART